MLLLLSLFVVVIIIIVVVVVAAAVVVVVAAAAAATVVNSRVPCIQVNRVLILQWKVFKNSFVESRNNQPPASCAASR